MGVSAVILAGGLSRRFGRMNKLLSELDGRTMIEITISGALTARIDEVIVVTGFDAKNVEKAAYRVEPDRRRLRCVFNPDFQSGLASSIVWGSRSALPGSAVLIWPGDKPLIRSTSVDTMLESGSDERIVVPVYRGRRGHPVYFGSSYRHELLDLEGDAGARVILDRHSGAVLEVEVEDRGVVLDVDTETDLAAILKLPGDQP